MPQPWAALLQIMGRQEGGNSIKNVKLTLRPEHPTDELEKGIWANKIGKVALNLLRVR